MLCIWLWGCCCCRAWWRCRPRRDSNRFTGSQLERLRDPPAHGTAQRLAGIPHHTVPYHHNDQLAWPALLLRRARLAFQWGVQRMPLLPAKHRSRAFRELLKEVAGSFAPDIAMVEFAPMAQYLLDAMGFGEGCRTVFTDHEHGEALPPRIGPGGWGRRRDQRLWPHYVRHYYRRADVVQALTKDDADRLSELLNRPVPVRPPVVSLPEAPVAPSPDHHRLLFFGSYQHHPNPEAAAFLAREVLPRVRKEVADAELWLAGTEAGNDVRALGKLSGVSVPGFVEDLPALLAQVRCVVAPVFSGAGVRMKVLTGLAHGLPVVSNALGLSGVDAPADAVLRGETADELAAACVRLLKEPRLAASAGAAGREWALANLGPRNLALQQYRVFEELLS